MLLSAIAVTSCSRTNPDTPLGQSAKPSLFSVSSTDINDYLSQVKGISGTRASEVSIEPIVSGTDTVMYLINYEKGWEVLSADLRVSRVLMCCDDGNCSVQDLQSNPLSADYFNDLASALSSAKNDPGFSMPEDASDSWLADPEPTRDSALLYYKGWVLDGIETVTLESRVKNHLLSTHWGQSSPWNVYGPYKSPSLTEHCLMGCVPVAAGQVLYYLQNKFNLSLSVYGSAVCNAYIPTNANYIVLQSTDVAFSNASVNNWSAMALDASGNGTDVVSALLLMLGYQYEAHYGRTSTSAYTSTAVSVFPGYQIQCQSTSLANNYLSTMTQVLEDELYDDDLPILASVSDVNYGGHSIVIDGYKYERKQTMYRYALRLLNPNGIPVIGVDPYEYSWEPGPISETRFVAINWGWNGSGDSMNGSPVWYNIINNWIVGSYNFSQWNYIVHDFCPIS